MNTILYTDVSGKYSLLDYSRSHSQLLLRKREDGLNTDILFKSVRGIFIPTEMEGIAITVISNPAELPGLNQEYGLEVDNGYRVYSIRTSTGDKFLLNAGVFGVFNNRLDILETSIGDFTWSSENQLLFWSE